MTIQEAKTGGLIKEIIELRKYEKEILKELDKRYKNELPVAKRKIKELRKWKRVNNEKIYIIYIKMATFNTNISINIISTTYKRNNWNNNS